ncbi:sugar phosphate isomerase/epimerase family protein [Commensalibacter oyaizuii]|uniref:Sugar phosphate isomerase/epimerase family protein n=1 Tax=Commensalibacter oyaizuii TaxID=3043873 RepID=A0ABT6Q2A0_9PROT|nr:sugar phosphate isomerase/epimerase family protein [Commensalibacter sp. TBRC 16381]MDI2091223.1 sugar phosphate isomerase/epimerase family protein [Commensalibacter sp. TBRC 16381]
MRKIGCCTWIFNNEPLEVTTQRLHQCGLHGAELHGDINRINPVQAGQLFSDKGLEIFSITPGDADIAHPDRKIRQEGLTYYEKLIEWVLKLDQKLTAPIISCHGLVQRIRPISTQEEENDLLVDSTQKICEMAKSASLNIVFEILNRYESHQIRTVTEGLDFLKRVNAPNLKLLPDAYHMNIEEANPAEALRLGHHHIGLYHAADSNRGAIGEGHTDFAAQFGALNDIQYSGPIILEVAAPGPDPFNTNKGEGFKEVLQKQLVKSVQAIRALGS